MANEMPKSSDYSGLSRKVLQYSESFTHVVDKLKQGTLTDADWAPFEEVVDTANYSRLGVFSGAQAEAFGWPTYRDVITQYGALTDWEGTLRGITETDKRVILELEERNTSNGVMDVSNTVTIYDFNDAGKIIHLDVYVMPLEKR